MPILQKPPTGSPLVPLPPRRRSLRLAALLLLLCGLGLGPPALAAPTAAPPLVDSIEGVSSYLLPNGLTLLLVPEPTQPTVTVHIVYRVGARHEGAGESGMAHLLEHMLYKGSPRHRDLLTEYEQHGAVYNAETEKDYTAYYQTLGSSPDNLRFALDVEADRMAAARLEQSDLAKEFSVVRNELELGENSPEELLMQRLQRVAFSWHSYGRDVIGSRSDIEGVPIDRLRLFYRQHYRPDNAVLIVAGKFEPLPTLRLVTALFGHLPRPPRPQLPTYTVEPVQDGERTVTLRRAGEVQLVGLLYHGLPAAAVDYPAAEAAVDILTRAGSGRAYRALVESQLASGLRGEVSQNREPGTVALFADVAKSQSVELARDKLLLAVDDLARQPITPAELRRFQSRSRKEFARTSADPAALAAELGRWAAMGDWRLRYLHRDRIEQLTADSVAQFARRYLLASNRSVGLFLPTALPQRSPLPPPIVESELQATLHGYRGQPGPVAGDPFVATAFNIESRLQRLKLPSGMQVVLLPKPARGQTVQLLLQVAAGSAQAVRGRGGLIELLAPMLERGTSQRSYVQIGDALDSLAAELALPSPSLVPVPSLHQQLSVETSRPHVGEVLRLLAELVAQPSFPSDQLELVRREQQTALQAAAQEPLALAENALLRRLLPYPADDPRYIPTLAERQSRLAAVRADELRQFHRDHWGGAAAQLAVVGDFDPAVVTPAIAAAFASWKAPQPYARLPFPYRENGGAAETISIPDRPSAVAMAGQRLALRDSDPDYPALVLFGFLLGGHDNARLNLRLREESGAAYTVAASVTASPYEPSGMLLVHFTCAPGSVAPSVARLERELAELVENGISERELRAAQRAYQKLFEVELASDGALAALLVDTLEVGRTLHFVDQTRRQLLALGPTDFLAAVRRHIVPSRLVKVVAGDFAAVRAAPKPK